jgi:hypothetical protein
MGEGEVGASSRFVTKIGTGMAFIRTRIILLLPNSVKCFIFAEITVEKRLRAKWRNSSLPFSEVLQDT